MKTTKTTCVISDTLDLVINVNRSLIEQLISLEIVRYNTRNGERYQVKESVLLSGKEINEIINRIMFSYPENTRN